jgi:hypothetical protein
MEPAQTIIRKLGGPSSVAEMLDLHRTRVSAWQRSRASGGTGGQIPQRHIRRLLDQAKRRGIALRLADFFVEARRRSRAA